MEKLQIYRCNNCGNMVELIRVGGGNLTCCDQRMQLLTENTTDAATEKHVPVIEKLADGTYKVKVGSVEHPMEEKHFIEWIQLVAGQKAFRTFLSPGQNPEAIFKVESDDVFAREYCNLHGLWKG